MFDPNASYAEIVKSLDRDNHDGDIVGVSRAERERMGHNRSPLDDIASGHLAASDELRDLARRALAKRRTVGRSNPHEGSY